MSNKHKRRFKRLQAAVQSLYTAALWRPVVPAELENESELWTELRDAAGLDKGTKLRAIMGPPTEKDY